jgi:hypothetical protein
MGDGRVMLRSAVFVGLILGAAGCGGPEGAGSIDMGKAKAVAAERGVPEAKAAPPVRSTKVTRPGTAPRPTEALPKGGR